MKPQTRPASQTKYNPLWGWVQDEVIIADGIVYVSTPSHGGYVVSPELNMQIHEAWRYKSGSQIPEQCPGYYEHDCAWAVVALTFPQFFEQKTVDNAELIAKNYFPHQYEQVFGIKLDVSESNVLKQERFDDEHKNDYIVISAFGSWHEKVPSGFVGVSAAIGGRPKNGRYPDNVKYFLVPDEEYTQPRDIGGFVIDLNRHQEWTDHV